MPTIKDDRKRVLLENEDSLTFDTTATYVMIFRMPNLSEKIDGVERERKLQRTFHF
jgi:hypothetical protein